MKFAAGLLSVLFASAVHAQLPITPPPIGVPPALEVQRLAPQLVQFFGSTNFQALVNGLATGAPVLLSTTDPASGLTQTVTFTPGSTLGALQIAQTLEAARQSLISRGISAPTAQQTAVTLVGGALPTAAGTVQVNGLVTAITSGAASAAAGGSAPSPAAIIQQQNTPSAAVPRPNTSDSPLPRGISDSPPAAGPAATATPSSAATPTSPSSPPASIRTR